MPPQKPLSPEAYLRTKVRKLLIDKCYINPNWKESGMASIIICRKHKNGNFTVGIYLVDLYALGTKDTLFKFNISQSLLDEVLDRASSEQLMETDYVLVHNIIYGANAFADDNGYKISKDFALTQFILEEDTEDIDLMEIEFGRDGEPFLIL